MPKCARCGATKARIGSCRRARNEGEDDDEAAVWHGRRGRCAAGLLGLSSGAALGADLTVTSWGGAYQDAQREVYFEPFKQATGTRPGRGRLERRRRRDPRQGRGRRPGMGRGPGRGGGAGARLRGGPVRADRLGCASAARTSSSTPRSMIAASAPSSGRPRSPTTPTRSPTARRSQLGRLLGYREVPRQARPAPRAQIHARVRAHGRRRRACRGLRRAAHRGRASTAPSPSSTRSRTTSSGGRRAPSRIAAAGLGRGDHDQRLQRPHLGGQPEEGRNFKVVWPGSIYAVDSWVILANSPNKEAGLEFIAFASQPERQSNLPESIAYGVTHREAAAEIDTGDPPGSADRAGQPRRSRSSSTPSSGSRTSSR